MAEEKQRCLIVDDTDDLRRMLAQLFGIAGFDAEEARDGVEAMALFWKALKEHRPYSVVVVDIAMPGIDGFEVEQKMRRAERELKLNKRCVIIANTGYMTETINMEKLQSSTFDAMVEKGGLPNDLPALAKCLLRGEK